MPDTLGRIAETKESPWSTWFNFYKYTQAIPGLMGFDHTQYAHGLVGMTDGPGETNRGWGRSLGHACEGSFFNP